MNGLTDWVLSILANYGALILLFIAYVGSLGIPFPITPVIIAAGALAHQGIIDWRVALLACLCGAVLADHSEYLLGHWTGGWLKRRFENKLIWQRAQATINRQGGWAVLLTRFWLTPLAPAINVIAGSRYPYRRFLIFDLSGELLWVLLYGGLGYLFAGQWQLVSQTVGDFSGVSFALVILAGVVYFLAQRRFEKRRQLENTQNQAKALPGNPLAFSGLAASGKWPWAFSVRKYTAGRHSAFYIRPYIQKINHSWADHRYDWYRSDTCTAYGDWKWNAHYR
jgi:membrane-associated protein